MTILGVTTLLFALTLNFKHAFDDYGILDNKLHLEVLAQTNSSQTGGSSSGDGSSSWNNWSQWLSQGLTKDEREYVRPCPSSSSSGSSGSASGGYGGASGSISGSTSNSQTNPSGRNEITCAYGSTNCTSVGC